MEYIVKILAIENENPLVKRFVLEKPSSFSFIPGHSCMLAINKPELREEKRSFCFTSANKDDYIEFMIKRHGGGITEQLHKLKAGDSLILSDIFGSIRYKGKGFFIAGGQGITPFLAIFRQLAEEKNLEGNWLFVSAQTAQDIIREKELRDLFKERVVFTLTRELKDGYEHGHIDASFIKKYINNFQQEFYVCGPDNFVKDMKRILANLKVLTNFYIMDYS